MLVDDEFTVRKAVINKIDWHQYGFDIVCEAENGQEALEMFEQYVPDVVITDIKMPYMDGLELSEKILAKYPFTKIIILTGFDEFEYARKGINLQIVEYILKPIRSKTLIEVLQNLKVTIDEEIKNRQDLHYLKDHFDKSFPLMRNAFLKGWVKGKYDDKYIEEYMKYYNLSLNGNYFTLVTIRIDNYYKDQEYTQSGVPQLKMVSLLNLLDEINQRIDLGIYFLDDCQIIMILPSTSTHKEAVVVGLLSKLEEVRQGVEKYLGFTVTIGIGFVSQSYTHLQQSFQSAENAQAYKLSLGTNTIINIEDMEKNKDQEVLVKDNELRWMLRALKAGNREEYQAMLKQILQGLLSSQNHIAEYQIRLYELATHILKTAKEAHIDITELLNAYPIFTQLSESSELEMIFEMFLAMGDFLIDEINKNRTLSTDSMVERAKAYAEEHYADAELNIDQMSAYLHYSPNYFSSIFKKETGEAFMRYLLGVRLEAGKDLLVTTDKKTFEIATEVGFASPNYFSYCFKKEVGQSPSQYRKEKVS